MGLKDLFKKKQYDKKLIVLLMECSLDGQLEEVIEAMQEQGKEYAMENVRKNFIRILFDDCRKAYGVDNIDGLFPDQWEAPIFRKEKADMDDIAIGCVRTFIKRVFPQLDSDAVEIKLRKYPDREYVAAYFDVPIAPER